MKSRTASFSLTMAGLCMVLAGGGCQNSLRVRVEKVRGVSSVSRESRVGQTLEEAIENLTRVKEQCTALDRSLSDYVLGFPEDQREAELSHVSGYQTVLSQTKAAAESLIAECESAFRPASADGVVVVPRATLRKARDFLDQTASNMVSWRTTLAKFQHLQQLSAEVDRGLKKVTAEKKAEAKRGADVWSDLSNLLAAAEEGAKRTKVGFGGFMTTDIFVINPSDPKYQEILGKPGLTTEPLTEASVAASGDSAIMLVMENPGQVRVYQVSMDPTQITRNIGLIVSKATAAAAKYAGAGL